MLEGKEILLGVCGSIAAYKAAELARLFVKAGARVQVVMTASAREFITPLTFHALTGREAYSEMFQGGAEVATAHIALARRADLVVLAPASARMLSRIAHGSAEDLLSTAVIAASSPVVVAPAMNPQMYIHPAVQKNLETIGSWPRYFIATPGTGEMACGETGLGRLAEPEALFEECAWVLAGGRRDMAGLSLVISAGATIEDIDPVRFLSNRSTGKMGFALAKAAARRGASVKLVTSNASLPTPAGCQRVPIRSAVEMHDVIHAALPCDIVVMAAAVADYRPAKRAEQKIKKTDAPLAIELTRNPDILASLPPSDARITVGFAAETENLLAYAQDKLARKRLDLIVANDVTQAGSGFGVDTNQVTLLAPHQTPESLPLMTKEHVAEAILDRILAIRAEKHNAKESSC
jgi:phosphopantothenoylcysteine decarboxylase/phosphopantothenate--cysteine ligase